MMRVIPSETQVMPCPVLPCAPGTDYMEHIKQDKPKISPYWRIPGDWMLKGIPEGWDGTVSEAEIEAIQKQNTQTEIAELDTDLEPTTPDEIGGEG